MRYGSPHGRGRGRNVNNRAVRFQKKHWAQWMRDLQQSDPRIKHLRRGINEMRQLLETRSREPSRERAAYDGSRPYVATH